jgi:hypothetical protein
VDGRKVVAEIFEIALGNTKLLITCMGHITHTDYKAAAGKEWKRLIEGLS